MRLTRIGSGDLDAETLQTDVMRFMAILGFCLMAILALVRNVDSLPGTKQAPSALRAIAEEEPSASRVSAEEEPSALRASAEEEPSASRVSAPERAVQPPPPQPNVQPTPKIKAAPPVPSVEKQSLEPPRAKRPVRVAPQPLAKIEPTIAMPPPPRPSPPTVAKQPPATVAEAESLVLRFASDTDFLKLVSGAVIEVYAYDKSSAFKLTPGLAFATAPRPPKVHELLEETIPALVRKALSRTTAADGSALVWGVHLPPDIESSIERHLSQKKTGVLLIDRNGSVHHASSS